MKHERIAIAAGSDGGRIVIRGTDVPVCEILSALGSGTSVPELLMRHQQLCEEDIGAAHAFAADYLRDWIGVLDWVKP